MWYKAIKKWWYSHILIDKNDSLDMQIADFLTYYVPFWVQVILFLFMLVIVFILIPYIGYKLFKYMYI